MKTQMKMQITLQYAEYESTGKNTEGKQNPL